MIGAHSRYVRRPIDHMSVLLVISVCANTSGALYSELKGYRRRATTITQKLANGRCVVT